jgi:hypothetical protein
MTYWGSGDLIVIFDLPQNNWNIVESGVKHHKNQTKPNSKMYRGNTCI